MHPIVVALDLTLTPADTRLEALVARIKSLPAKLLSLLPGLRPSSGKIAEATWPSAANLPYHAALLDYLKAQRSLGRRIFLTTLGQRELAEAVARHTGCIDEVIALGDAQSTQAKLDLIRERTGGSFVYAGSNPADRPLWTEASAAILVGTSGRLARELGRERSIEQAFPATKAGLRTWLRALRLHQWLKNLLLFVPLLTAFAFADAYKSLAAVIAFFAFCLTASATYLVNDLWDISSDRAHARKRTRAFASAQVSIPAGLSVAALLLVAAFLLAQLLPAIFTLALLAYLVLTSAYSWILKNYVIVDVLTLALLFTLRIIAGSLAVTVPVSSWLFVFSVFIFFSLAIVKRCAELVHLRQSRQESTHGRDYNVTDLQVLWPLGVGASLSAVVIFTLYISAMEKEGRYGSPQILWLAGVGLIYWLSRLWIKTGRGEMHDDPLVFAARDRGSRVTLLFMVAAVIAAHFIR